MQTSRKLSKIPLQPNKIKQILDDKTYKPKPLDEKKWPFLAFSGCIWPVSLNF
jgi:hypothetical protein